MEGLISINPERYSKYRAKKKFGSEFGRTNGYIIYSSDNRYSVFRPANGKCLELIATMNGRETPRNYLNMIDLLQDKKLL